MSPPPPARPLQAFKVKGLAKGDQRFTVPEPFNLHSQYYMVFGKKIRVSPSKSSLLLDVGPTFIRVPY